MTVHVLQVCTRRWRRKAVDIGRTQTRQLHAISTGAPALRAAEVSACRPVHGAGVRQSVPADSWSTGGATQVDVGPSVRVQPPRQRRPPPAVVDADPKCRRQRPPESAKASSRESFSSTRKPWNVLYRKLSRGKALREQILKFSTLILRQILHLT